LKFVNLFIFVSSYQKFTFFHLDIFLTSFFSPLTLTLFLFYYFLSLVATGDPTRRDGRGQKVRVKKISPLTLTLSRHA
jgi:hypothetical protein